MENFEDGVRIKKCAEEIVEVLSKNFPNEPGMVFTTMTYLLINMTKSFDVNPKFVVDALEQGFAVRELIDAEPPNDFVN